MEYVGSIEFIKDIYFADKIRILPEPFAVEIVINNETNIYSYERETAMVVRRMLYEDFLELLDIQPEEILSYLQKHNFKEIKESQGIYTAGGFEGLEI